MSIQANFAEWCHLRGYRARPTVYLKHSLVDLENNDARLVRMIEPEQRAGNRKPQMYVVEMRYNGTIYYPFGTAPMEQKQLLAAMTKAMNERTER